MTINTTSAVVWQRGSKAVYAAKDRMFLCAPAIRYIFFVVFELPILQLYISGPSIAGYGFWQGQQPAEICSTLTTVSAKHWQLNPVECGDLIYRRFESFMVLVYVLIYTGTLGSVYICIMLRLMKLRH